MLTTYLETRDDPPNAALMQAQERIRQLETQLSEKEEARQQAMAKLVKLETDHSAQVSMLDSLKDLITDLNSSMSDAQEKIKRQQEEILALRQERKDVGKIK